ncbi:MAG: hypothetical protein K8I30_03080 [Anaerolineae bacterium]|nr:hypothetical protein [Anaerolineae bacterium]
MDYDIQQKIVRAFDLEAFRVGGHTPKKDKETQLDSLLIKLLWAAELDYYISPVVVSVIHTSTVPRGLLLILSTNKKGQVERFQAGITVELPDWIDPVEQGLHCVDLATGGGSTYGDGAYDIELCIEARMLSSRVLILRSPTQQPSLRVLGEGVFATIEEIVKRSEDRRIQKFLKSPSSLEE